MDIKKKQRKTAIELNSQSGGQTNMNLEMLWSFFLYSQGLQLNVIKWTI